MNKYHHKYMLLLDELNKIFPNTSFNLSDIIKLILNTPGFAILSNMTLTKFLIDILNSEDGKMKALRGILFQILTDF